MARELERRWEAALTAKREADEALEQFLRSNPARLTEAERDRIRRLVMDVPAIWHSEGTPGQTVNRSFVILLSM